jgi:hypothetical protein
LAILRCHFAILNWITSVSSPAAVDSTATGAARSKVPQVTPETLIRVTLNLTLAARWMIVQTSDFRLTTGPKPVSETAQKQVVLKYRNWTGLLCYTGIARWLSHDTAQWLTRILTHGPGEQRSPREIAEVLVKEGGWLRRVHINRRRHTFTLTLFANKLPWVCMISNCQRAGQNDLPQPLDHFIVTCHRPRPSGVYVTGWSDAVNDTDRRELLDHLSSERDPHVLRRSAANVSRRCAGKSQQMVGENCVVAHLLPDGSGEVQVFGNPGEAFVPTMIVNGENVAKFAPIVFGEAGATTPQRLVGATWTPSGTRAAMLASFRDITKTHSGW